MRLKCDLGLISVAFKSISFYSNYNGLVLNAGLKAGIYSVAIFHSNILQNPRECYFLGGFAVVRPLAESSHKNVPLRC